MHKQYAKLATCQLNQWAMSFIHNRDNIIKSIQMCKDMGASYRLGPELEVCGYNCEDHFFEADTMKHSWEMLIDILKHTENILCDIGMPVSYKGVTYNCRVFALDGKILLIRPKMFMAHGNNYREVRWFKPWTQNGTVDFQLPRFVSEAIG